MEMIKIIIKMWRVAL